MPRISVIIPNWNGKHLLNTCLVALRQQRYRDFEIILVDNGSEDGSPDYVRSYFPEVRMLPLPENRGFTGGVIAGYQQSSGELIALLNNDTEADLSWLEEIQKASEMYPHAGSFASKMMYFDDHRRVENCGFDLGVAGETMDLGRDEVDGPEWHQVRRVFGGCGGAVAYRRQMLDDIGFLDPDFVMIYEDADLSFRAQLRGYECLYVPNAIVYHRYRVTIGKAPSQQAFYSQRNIEFLYLKNMPLALILRFLPQRVMYELGAAIYFIKMGNARAFFLSKFDVLKCLPSILRKRGQIQRRRTVSDCQLQRMLSGKPTFHHKCKKFLSLWSSRETRTE